MDMILSMLLCFDQAMPLILHQKQVILDSCSAGFPLATIKHTVHSSNCKQAFQIPFQESVTK